MGCAGGRRCRCVGHGSAVADGAAMICRCSFCRADDDRPVFTSRLNRSIAICEACCRKNLRQLGEFVTEPDSVVPFRRPGQLAPLIRIETAD
jgi:hypothetical protein